MSIWRVPDLIIFVDETRVAAGIWDCCCCGLGVVVVVADGVVSFVVGVGVVVVVDVIGIGDIVTWDGPIAVVVDDLGCKNELANDVLPIFGEAPYTKMRTGGCCCCGCDCGCCCCGVVMVGVVILILVVG